MFPEGERTEIREKLLDMEWAPHGMLEGRAIRK
jgi:hypothetical protein